MLSNVGKQLPPQKEQTDRRMLGKMLPKKEYVPQDFSRSEKMNYLGPDCSKISLFGATTGLRNRSSRSYAGTLGAFAGHYLCFSKSSRSHAKCMSLSVTSLRFQNQEIGCRRKEYYTPQMRLDCPRITTRKRTEEAWGKVSRRV